MEYNEVRSVAITAFFSDDTLLRHLVLKGGNALSLVYGLSKRTSLDLDFSMDSDFADVADARKRLFQALRDRFDAVGLRVFDEQLEPKPQLEGEDTKPWWGGYELRFKLIDPQKYEVYKNRLDKLRINAMVTGPKQSRTFTVDLSKCEYTGGKVEREFNSYTIYVYTPEMIVIEKLRAICQQMPEYPHKTRQSGRARDFYDIYCVLTELRIDLASEENLELARRIFAAKQVPLSLLPKINEYRELHRLDWPAVKDSAGGTVKEFDFYFDFVLAHAEQLKALWVE
ncbi:MAG: nucleotidyl transferase AbiEii/AbiGii toxin family protein [Terriglobia bacterium]